MEQAHSYSVGLTWTSNKGTGTSDYKAYDRNHVISIPGKELIEGSADPQFRGDAGRYNPEELLVASLSACHMLWYLHLCADAGVIVTEYTDQASGTMIVGANGGQFTEVILHPMVTVRDEAMIPQAMALHAAAHQQCFIARSVNFPVRHEAECVGAE